MNRAAPHPVSLRVHDTQLACQVKRAMGYRADCACGWSSPLYADWNEARQAARWHNPCDHVKAPAT